MTKIPHLAVIFGTGIRISFGIKGVGSSSSSSRFSKLKKNRSSAHMSALHTMGD